TMYPLPFPAQQLHVLSQRRDDPGHVASRKPVILAQLDRTDRAVQIEHCLVALADDMDVRRRVVIRIDDHSQTAYSQDRRQVESQPLRLAYTRGAAVAIAYPATHTRSCRCSEDKPMDMQ